MEINISAELGQGGAWRQQIEVKGRGICQNHLTAKLSGRPCVYSHSVIIEKYEEIEETTDDEGNFYTSTHSGSKIIADNKTQTVFFLEDDMRKITINPVNA